VATRFKGTRDATYLKLSIFRKVPTAYNSKNISDTAKGQNRNKRVTIPPKPIDYMKQGPTSRSTGKRKKFIRLSCTIGRGERVPETTFASNNPMRATLMGGKKIIATEN